MGSVNATPAIEAAAARGAAIGTTIKAAVDTAFPAITPVVNAIAALFQKGRKQEEKPVQDTVKSALDEQKKVVEASFKAYKASLKISANGVKQLSDLSRQADLANKHLNIVRSYAKVDQWAACGLAWSKAQEELDKIANFKDRDKLQDPEATDAIGVFFEAFEYSEYKEGMKDRVIQSKNYATIAAGLERPLNLTITLTQISGRCLRDLLNEATKD